MSYCRQVLLLRACGHRRATLLALRPVIARRRLSTAATATPAPTAGGDSGASAAGAVGGQGPSPELAAAKNRRDDK